MEDLQTMDKASEPIMSVKFDFVFTVPSPNAHTKSIIKFAYRINYSASEFNYAFCMGIRGRDSKNKIKLCKSSIAYVLNFYRPCFYFFYIISYSWIICCCFSDVILIHSKQLKTTFSYYLCSF